MHWLFACQP
ncbi:mltA-interacting protein, partial [Yersinia pestis PY-66]